MASESSQHEGHHEVGHVVPVRILLVTGMGLLALTFITVLAASFDFGNLNIWIALAIAVVKATLVVMYFMHLRYDRPFHGVVLVSSLAFVALFISFALTDTTEYAGDIDSGDAPKVVEKLTALGE